VPPIAENLETDLTDFPRTGLDSLTEPECKHLVPPYFSHRGGKPCQAVDIAVDEILTDRLLSPITETLKWRTLHERNHLDCRRPRSPLIKGLLKCVRWVDLRDEMYVIVVIAQRVSLSIGGRNDISKLS
jgi:hypothetical protein